MSEVADEECARYVVAFTVRHEQGIKLADKLIFDVLETLREVVLRYDHTVEDLNSIFAQLIVVAQAQVDDVAHERVQGSLIVL